MAAARGLREADSFLAATVDAGASRHVAASAAVALRRQLAPDLVCQGLGTVEEVREHLKIAAPALAQLVKAGSTSVHP